MPKEEIITAEDFFDGFDDELLIEMIMEYPGTLKRMCNLISLDLQLAKESYDKSTSNRGGVC
tara:strand:- start:220 stop:405 length:186 start_codon:yes stop_codon:yes gene_type:complete